MDKNANLNNVKESNAKITPLSFDENAGQLNPGPGPEKGHHRHEQADTVSNLKTPTYRWKCQVKDIERFIFPSLRYETPDASSHSTVQSSMTWTQVPNYANIHTRVSEEDETRLSAQELKKKQFDRKLEFAEKLLRQEVLEQALLDEEQDFGSSDDEYDLPPARIMNFRHRRQSTFRKSTSKIKVPVPVISENPLKQWSIMDTCRHQQLEPINNVDQPNDDNVALTHPMSPRSAYFGECLEKQIIPETLFRRISDLGELDLSHFGMGNIKAGALAESIKHFPSLRRLNLSDNRLTHTSLLQILQAVKGRLDLEGLDFSSNVLGLDGSTILAKYIGTLDNLTQLIIRQCALTDLALAPLVSSLLRHRVLTHLDLSHNDISTEGGILISHILDSSSTNIVDLDISWNRIGEEGGKCIGMALKHNWKLRRLNASMNRFGNLGSQHLAIILLENATLKDLDLSNNNIGDVGAITLAYTISQNTELQVLNVLDNPIGQTGTRAIISCIADGSNCIFRISPQDFDPPSADLVFDKFHPALQSPYVLDLTNSPYHYVIACELVRMTARYRFCTFHDVVYQGEHETSSQGMTLEYSVKHHAMMNVVTKRPYVVPPTGVLTIACQYAPSMPQLEWQIEHSSLNFLLGMIKRATVPRVRSILFQVSMMDIYVTTENVKYIIASLKGFISPVEVLATMLLRVLDGENSFELIQSCLSQDEQVRMIDRYGPQTLKFNAKNPCGHWYLDLFDKAHRSIAMWFANINGMESITSAANAGKRHDTSQQGNWNNFRNEKFNSQALVLDHKFFTNLPRTGTLEFHYVPTTRPDLKHQVPDKLLTDAALDEILATTGISSNTSSGYLNETKTRRLKIQFVQLHIAFSGKCVTSDQVCRVMKYFPKDHEGYRVRIIYACFQGLVDFENLDSCLGHLTARDRTTVYQALGYLNTINPLRPYREYQCRLHFADERVLLRTLMDLAIVDPKDSLRSISNDGVHLYELYAIATMPTSGSVTFWYISPSKDQCVASKPRMAIVWKFLLGSSDRQAALSKLASKHQSITTEHNV